MKKLLLCVIVLVVAVLVGCSRAPKLGVEEKATVDEFLRKYLADMKVTEEDIGPVVAIGDAAVPHLIEAIGNVKPSQLLIQKNSDCEMVNCLARIGTPRAINGICKVLRHKYRGYYGYDRQQAAVALVRLGARDKAHVLREAIAKHKELVAKQRYTEMFHSEIVVLENALAMLEAGEGVQDTSKFGRGGIFEYGFLQTVKPALREEIDTLIEALEKQTVDE